MEKNSKDSLKNWVNKIRNTEFRLKHLYEKLEYLEMKSIGYNSPSFEPKFRSQGDTYKNFIDYWLEKIDECNKLINELENEVSKYYEFRCKRNNLEKIILDKHFYELIPPRVIMKELKLTRNNYYLVIKKLKHYYKSK